MTSLLETYMLTPPSQEAIDLAAQIAIQTKANDQHSAYRKALLKKASLEAGLNLINSAENTYREILQSFPLRLSSNQTYIKDTEARSFAHERVRINSGKNNTPYFQLIDIFIALREWDNAQTIIDNRRGHPVNIDHPANVRRLSAIQDRLDVAMGNHQTMLDRRQTESGDYEVPEGLNDY